MANRLFLVPIVQTIEDGRIIRGPGYFQGRHCPACPLTAARSMMDYGFLPSGLVLVKDIDAPTLAFLQAQGDVYTFPEVLTVAITDPNIDTFFEGLHIPADWLTPSTSYLELLRFTAGLFQFNQRYGGISGGQTLLGNGVTLSTRFNQLTAQQQAWFNATAASFGWNNPVQGNPPLRTLAKQASSLWEGTPFYLGGIEF